MARPTGRPVRDEVLAAAKELIQTVGVGGFSYSHLAEQIGIKAPSIHHYFKHKEDLVAEVASIYRQQFGEQVHAIDDATTIERLRSYAALFAATASGDRNCLCGAVAAEWATVGEGPRKQVEGFFDDQVGWLAAQIGHGRESGELRADIDAAAAAKTVLATLEGALLLSRANQTTDPIETTSDLLLTLLTPT